MTSSKDAWKAAKIVLLYGSVILAVVCKAVRILLFPDFGWLNMLFVISLSSFVGIITNFIAIKMLFCPLEWRGWRKPFGWQGIIPANQPKIAEKLGKAIEDKLLDGKTVVNYIQENDLIQEAGEFVITELREYVKNPENRKAILQYVYRVYKENEEDIKEDASKVLNYLINEFLNNDANFDTFWAKAKPIVSNFIQSKRLRQDIAKFIKWQLVNNGEKFAAWLHKQINQKIESLPVFKKYAAKILKWMSGLNYEELAQQIDDILNSDEFWTSLVKLIDDNAHKIDEFLEAKQIRKRLKLFYEEIKTRAGKYINQNAIPFIQEKLEKLIEDEKIWEVVDARLYNTAHYLIDRLNEEITKPETIAKINGYIPKLLDKFSVKKLVEDKLKDQNPQELETLLLDVIGEQFVAIEVLGGIIGAVIGLLMAFTY